MDDSTFSGVGIRITSDPDTTRIDRTAPDSAHRRARLPLRLMLVSGLAPGYDGSPIPAITPDSFGDVMAGLSPTLRIEVDDRIGSKPVPLDVVLTFRSMNDFKPGRLAHQIPAVAALLAVREALEDVGAGRIDHAEFRARLDDAGVDSDWTRNFLRVLEAREPAARRPQARTSQPGSDDAIDRLLSIVDAPGLSGAPEPVPSAGSSGLFEALLGAAVGESHSDSVDLTGARALTAELDDVIERQLLAVIGDADFRRLESAWRGLRFLVDHIDFRRDVVLDVLPASRDALSESVYTHVLMPEHRRSDAQPPLAALLMGFDFTAGAADVALLADLAETGASLQIPVIASAAPAFFGVATMRGLERIPPIRQHLDAPAWIEWHKLRAREEALNLALAVPGFLARYPWSRNDPTDGLPLSESDDLWLGGAYVVGAAIARSFAGTGWPTRIRGGQAGVDGLPLRADARGAVPLGAMLSEERQADLAEAGFVVVGCSLNRDAAFVVHAPTVHRASHYDDPAVEAEAIAQASLPNRLFIARTAQFLLTFQEGMSTGADIEDVRTELESRLRGLLGAGESTGRYDAVAVEAVGDAQLMIRLRPPEAILEEPVNLVLGIRVPRSDAP